MQLEPEVIAGLPSFFTHEVKANRDVAKRILIGEGSSSSASSHEVQVRYLAPLLNIPDKLPGVVQIAENFRRRRRLIFSQQSPADMQPKRLLRLLWYPIESDLLNTVM